jgi:ABC-type transporter Mla subunit MlaD
VDLHRRTRRVRVGLLVLGSGALFLGMLFFVLGSSLTRRVVTFELLFVENVKGMVIGSRVNFQGVPVGAVHDIRFEDGLTLVEIAIDPAKAIVQVCTRARIDRLLVTGQVTIELEGYQNGAPVLSPGSRIMVKPSPMNQLTGTLPDTLERANRFLERTTGVMNALDELLGPANRESVTSILAHAAAAAAALEPRITRLADRAEAALAELTPLLAQARELLAGDDARALAAAARGAVRRGEALAAELEVLAREANGLLGSARRPALDLLAQARAALAELDRLARTLRLAPPSLLHGRDAQELAPGVPGGGR